MAIPKTLRSIPKENAQRLIVSHTRKGDGEWEHSPYMSDFVYKSGKGYKLLRPPSGPWGQWETGVVSM